MYMIKKILLPVDAYEFQPEAAEYAITLAKALDAKIAALYVLEPLPTRYFSEGGSLPPSLAEEEEAKRKAEAKMAEILSNFSDAHIETVEVVFGQAADQIIRIAGECAADMIVMASHCRSLVCRAVYGSVTSKILANTKIPVFVVPPKE